MKKKVLIAKGIITFTGLTLGAGFVTAYHYLWARRKETPMPQYTFFYGDVQGDCAAVDKTAKAISSRLRQKLPQQYAVGQVQDCVIGWDNPRWLITPKQGRAAAGVLVDAAQKENKDVKEALQAEQLKSVELKAWNAMLLNFGCNCRILTPLLMRLTWWYVSRRYYPQYKQRLQQAGEVFTPMGQARDASRSYVFVPLPEDIKHFKFTSFPEPELNPAGIVHKEQMSSRPSSPAEVTPPKPK